MKKAIDYQKKRFAELLKLIKENPDLPIVPMVDDNIIGEDSCGRWEGSLGRSYIADYIMGEDCVHYCDAENWEEIGIVLSEKYGYDASANMDDESAKRAYIEMPWIKAIIVEIDLPK